MPELPEVETIARGLNEILKAKKISKVEVLRQVSFGGEEKELEGRKIKKVWRRAKMILFEFYDWEKLMQVHLKMTGQLIWRNKKGEIKTEVAGGHPTSDWLESLPSKHTRVVIDFGDGSKLFFNDLRVFGWMRLITKDQYEKQSQRLPGDIVDKRFGLEEFKKILANSRRAVKLVIMDQQKVGGVGNIYACDGLNLARVDPRKKAKELSELEVKRLCGALKKVVSKGIKYGGATYSDFVSAAGIGGNYQKHFLVYDREGLECKNCGKKIKKIKLGGRGTYFCENCQE